MAPHSSHQYQVVLPDPEATLALGEALGRRLRPGQTLALTGELGAGKTLLARGVARGLGIDDPGSVCSPTYLLVVEHPGPVPMLHADAYLPGKLEAFLADGGLDYLWEAKGVVVVEWADRIPTLLPPQTLWVALEPAPQGAGRVARLRSSESRDFPWLGELRNMGSLR